MTAGDDRPGDDRPGTVALSCDRCGAPLAVGGGAGYATCAHCGCRLRVRRSASAAWTEALDEIAETSGRMERHLDRLARQGELAALDRAWGADREGLLTRTKAGSAPPTLAGVLFPVVTGGIAGVLLAGGGRWWESALLFAAPVACGIAAAAHGYRKLKRYRTAEADYRRRRAEMGRGD